MQILCETKNEKYYMYIYVYILCIILMIVYKKFLICLPDMYLDIAFL